MKKKTTIIVIIALLIILLIPIPMHLKDGGTVEYKALLYKVSKVHRLTGNIEKMYEILKEKNIKFFLDLEIHEYRIDDKISYDKEFLIQDPDGYLLRFNN